MQIYLGFFKLNQITYFIYTQIVYTQYWMFLYGWRSHIMTKQNLDESFIIVAVIQV